MALMVKCSNKRCGLRMPIHKAKKRGDKYFCPECNENDVRLNPTSIRPVFSPKKP